MGGNLKWSVLVAALLLVSAALVGFVDETIVSGVQLRNGALDSILLLLNHDWTLWTLIALGLFAVRRRMKDAQTYALAVGGAYALATVIKAIVMRPRPDMLVPLIEETGSAFPSAHALVLFAAAAVVATRQPRWACVAFIAATAVSLARVMGGVHYLSDVLAGASFGVLLGALVSLASRK